MLCLLDKSSKKLCGGHRKEMVRIIEKQNVSYGRGAVQRETSSN